MVCPSFRDKSSFSTGASLSFCICSSKRRDLKWSWRATFRSNASVRSAKPNPTWPKVSVLMTKYLKAKQYNKCLHTYKKVKVKFLYWGFALLLYLFFQMQRFEVVLKRICSTWVIWDHKMSFVISFSCPFSVKFDYKYLPWAVGDRLHSRSRISVDFDMSEFFAGRGLLFQFEDTLSSLRRQSKFAGPVRFVQSPPVGLPSFLIVTNLSIS